MTKHLKCHRVAAVGKGGKGRKAIKEKTLLHAVSERSPDKNTGVNQRQAERVYLQTGTDHQARARYYCCVPFGEVEPCAPPGCLS